MHTMYEKMQKTSVLPAASPGSLVAAGRSGSVLHLSSYDKHRGQHPSSGPFGSESRSCSSDPLRFAVGTRKVRPVIHSYVCSSFSRIQGIGCRSWMNLINVIFIICARSSESGRRTFPSPLAGSHPCWLSKLIALWFLPQGNSL